MNTPQWFKDLEEAGYPFKMEGRHEVDNQGKPVLTFGKAVTLKELIEACVDGLTNLYKTYSHPEVSKIAWVAVAGIPDGIYISTDGESPSAIGSTPEEAVSKLWILLNKK